MVTSQLHHSSRLYRGVTVTILRDLPGYGVYFASYRSLALVLEPGLAPEDASTLTQVFAGGSAGAFRPRYNSIIFSSPVLLHDSLVFLWWQFYEQILIWAKSWTNIFPKSVPSRPF